VLGAGQTQKNFGASPRVNEYNIFYSYILTRTRTIFHRTDFFTKNTDLAEKDIVVHSGASPLDSLLTIFRIARMFSSKVVIMMIFSWSFVRRLFTMTIFSAVIIVTFFLCSRL
uniref:Uncharacterized protein n=1 Tax=Romanomermis culicivorax TaxID=13658 RepID=A0A915J5U3_ROMCU